MGFWVYMLECSDGSYYIGHTDDPEKRFGQHQAGLIPGYTHTRRPVTLVYSQELLHVRNVDSRTANQRLEQSEKGGADSRRLEGNPASRLGNEESVARTLAVSARSPFDTSGRTGTGIFEELERR